jgi:hypothetical protein
VTGETEKSYDNHYSFGNRRRIASREAVGNARRRANSSSISSSPGGVSLFSNGYCWRLAGGLRYSLLSVPLLCPWLVRQFITPSQHLIGAQSRRGNVTICQIYRDIPNIGCVTSYAFLSPSSSSVVLFGAKAFLMAMMRSVFFLPLALMLCFLANVRSSPIGTFRI